MFLPDFDEDYLVLALIIFLSVVWITALRNEAHIGAAENIVTFGLGSIAGYMTRDKAQ